jgi:O-antigen ligase
VLSGALMWIVGFSLAFPDQVPFNAGMGIQIAFLGSLALLGIALLQQPVLRVTGSMRVWSLIVLAAGASLIPILILNPPAQFGTSPTSKWVTQILQLVFMSLCAAGLWHTARRRSKFTNQLHRGLVAGAWFTIVTSLLFLGLHLVGLEVLIPHNNLSFGYEEVQWRAAINYRDITSQTPRIFGFFSEPGFLSAYLAPLLLYAVALWKFSDRGRRDYGWLAFSLAIILAISSARTGQVAAVATLPLVLLFARRQMLLSKAYFTVAFLLVPLVLLGSALLRGGALEETDLSVIQRVAATVIGFEMFADHPLFGVGYGSFGFHYPAYLGRFAASPVVYEVVALGPSDEGGLPFTFNVAIRFLAELGLVGLILLLLLCFRMMEVSVRSGEPRSMAATLGFLAFFIAGIDSFVMFQVWVFFVLAQPGLYTGPPPGRRVQEVRSSDEPIPVGG